VDPNSSSDFLGGSDSDRAHHLEAVEKLKSLLPLTLFAANIQDNLLAAICDPYLYALTP
jgi:hypothetical protein